MFFNIVVFKMRFLTHSLQALYLITNVNVVSEYLSNK